MSNPFSKWFQREEEVVDETALSECHRIVEFSRTEYFPKFMAYLDREIDQPWKIGNETTMIEAASRVNAFKEVRAHLRRQVVEAQRLIQEYEGTNA